MTINEYCGSLKLLADALCDVGHVRSWDKASA
jgi:hypothetical protein